MQDTLNMTDLQDDSNGPKIDPWGTTNKEAVLVVILMTTN